jgi:ABC-type sugar transport system permease subunit
MTYPMVEALRLSFYKTNGTIEVWKGLNNYKYVLSSDVFGKAIFNTFFITFFQLVVAIPLSFVIALIINSLKTSKNLLKALFFIPYVTPAIAAGTLFLFVLHPQGILNQLTGVFGLSAVSWLESATSARFGAVLLSIWRSLGFDIIIFLAYLQAISPEYYEAAFIDGCSYMQVHRYITIPQMKGAFAFLITIGWIQGMQRFTDVYALGGMTGSPARALHTIVGFIYERGFGNYEFGVASAASYILFVIILIFTLINMKLSKTN